jgi:hypothetical protein
MNKQRYVTSKLKQNTKWLQYKKHGKKINKKKMYTNRRIRAGEMSEQREKCEGKI